MPVNSTTLTWANIFYIIMEIVIGLCAIVGNVLVIWVVKLNRSLHTTTFYFIVSLALADIAVGVLVMPLAVVVSLGLTVHFYSCLLMTCLLLVFTHASIMFLLAIAVDRYLRVKLTVRSRIAEISHFRPAMGLFVLLSLTVLSEAMVMDKKVKESFVLDTVSAVCSYAAHYKDHLKYWCRGYYRDYCNIIAFTPNSTGRVALRDTGEQLIVTVSCLTKEDAGWYWCGIQRDFARDDMDFTELVVTDYRGAHTSDFWSVKGKGHARGPCGGALQGWLSEQSAVSCSLDLTLAGYLSWHCAWCLCVTQPSFTLWRLKGCQREMQRQRVGLGMGLAWHIPNPF
ncbi:adenosine receptor A3 isoform X3 [Myotis myotis]|uniref:adenosine receptor A3 isoform X3 n=1 Tax=Myotis myotis TaxID=51298 RepID=UPI00174E1DE2|nr:adenosine receptor A3 isoform X3 [Myotis myotis]